MNKDEMIIDMAKVLCDKNCEECSSKLLVPCGYKSYCTKLYNANYRKIGEDEIVIKKSEYEKLTNDYLIMVNEGYYLGLAEGANEAEKKTAREILQIIKDEYEYIGNLERIIAKKYGIELG